MMEDQAVYSVLSKCFAPVDAEEWNQLTRADVWSEFLDGARRLLQDDRGFGRPKSPLLSVRRRCPLQEFLSSGEVGELFNPPTYEEKSAFAARHFTGGLPTSALPVESLYSDWTSSNATQAPFGRAHGLYLGNSARYMSSLVETLGLQVPPEFAACPDHLALELDLVAVMLRSGMCDEARAFLSERLAWLTDYRLKLLHLDDGQFYIGLVDVLLGIRACNASGEWNDTSMHEERKQLCQKTL